MDAERDRHRDEQKQTGIEIQTERQSLQWRIGQLVWQSMPYIPTQLLNMFYLSV